MKKRISSFFLIISICISMVFTPGCWDYTEFEQMILVSALGVDFDPSSNQVTVSLLYLLPSGGSKKSTDGNGKKPTTTALIKATDLTVTDALTRIQESTGKKLFFGYLDIMTVGKNAAEKIMTDIIALVDRAPQIRTTAYIVVAEDKASDVLETEDPDQTLGSGKYIYSLVEQSLNSGKAFPVKIHDFIENIAVSGLEPVAPKIKVIRKDQSQTGSSLESSSNEPSKPDRKIGFFEINGLAVFNKEYLAGWMDENESVGVNYVLNNKFYPFESIQASSEKTTKKAASFRIMKSKSNIDIQYENDMPVINLNIDAEADLRKYAVNMKPDLQTPEAIDILQQKLSARIKDEISISLKKAQTVLKTDIFGFGYELYRKDPALWRSKYQKKWNDIFPTLQVNINVQVKITNTGTNTGKLEPK